MALSYSTLFTDLGLIIKKLSTYQTMAGTTFPADRDALDTELANFLVCTNRLKPLYDAGQRSLVSLRQGLSGINTLRLQDQTTVLNELSLISSDINGVLRALYRQMTLDTESVDASVVTIGSASYAAANVGNGKVYTSKVLDGVSQPGAGMPANQLYAGVDSELTVPSETITMQCVADSEVDHVTEGSERWTVQGGQSYPKLSWETEGSGQGPGVTCFNSSSIIANKDFENWSSSTVPSSWTLTTGGAGISRESTNIYRGTYSMKLLGNASLLFDVNQAVSPARLTSRKKYCFSIAVKASSVPAAGNLVIKFTGTGYTASSTEKIDIAAGSLPTTWTLYQFWINLPAVLPSDWKLSITVTGPLSNAVSIYLDSISFAPAIWHGGIALGVVAGSTNWLRGDRVTFTLANNQAGVFQDWFRRYYGFQLRSDNAGGETIADSLAS